jgi:hypothetical protein
LVALKFLVFAGDIATRILIFLLSGEADMKCSDFNLKDKAAGIRNKGQEQ